MQKRKLNVMFCFPSYGGNGGISSEVPDIRIWFTEVLQKAKADSRIGKVMQMTLADTPITMVRNRFVVEARKIDIDVMVMVDSDMNPLLHKDDPNWKEFFASSFDFLYEHYEKGPCVVGSPYCGPPGVRGENVYVFEWQNYGDHCEETAFSLEQVPRMLAARMRGIQPAAALPTGLIMYDMRAFKLIEPTTSSKAEVLEKLMRGEINTEQASSMLHEGWFYYEWEDNFASQKSSTEDVTNTRDISLAGIASLGYNPIYCNWDSPAGHWKPWCVSGRPLVHDASKVAETFRRAVLSGCDFSEVVVDAVAAREGSI